MAGVVAALKPEARTLGRLTRRRDGLFQVNDGTVVAVSGIGCAAATAAAAALADAGADALVSWGTAGGLDSRLETGAICLPSIILSPDGVEFTADHHWHELLTAAIASRLTVVSGTLLTSNAAILDSAGKSEAFQDTGAVAVDMESSAVAAVALRLRLPFVAVRVIVDTAADTLPQAVIAATESGKVRIGKLALEIARHPREAAPLIRLARRYRVASQALASIARTGALAPLAFAVSSRTRIA